MPIYCVEECMPHAWIHTHYNTYAIYKQVHVPMTNGCTYSDPIMCRIHINVLYFNRTDQILAPLVETGAFFLFDCAHQQNPTTKSKLF